MKILSFLEDPLRTEISSFFKFCLLHRDIFFESRTNDELEKVREGLLGISPKKAIAYFSSEEERQTILIDEPLSTGQTIFLNDNIMILSPKEFNSDLPVPLKTAIYVEIFILKQYATCEDNQCVLRNFTQFTNKILCQNCQDSISKTNKSLDALRLLLFLKLSQQPSLNLNSLIHRSFVEVVKENDLSIKSPSLSVAVTDIIIDLILISGSTERIWLTKSSKDIHEQKQEIKKQYESYRSKLPKVPTMIIARRWNSWTPNQPRERLKDIGNKFGGGYFVSNGETNIVIDPGYGFLNMLYEFHNITVMDIDALLISHDHPDHASELSNFLSLRFVYSDSTISKLKVMLNPSSFYLYKRTLKYYSELIDSTTLVPFLPGNNFDFGNLKIESIAMYHDEIFHKLDEPIKEKIANRISDSQSLGLKISGKSPSGENFLFAIPGDTSFPELPDEIEKISEFFKNPDVAAIHLGSIEEDWKEKKSEPASSITYGKRKHLGVNGTIKLINLLNPKLATITEFGEELKENSYRVSITEMVKKPLVNSKCQVIPADIPLYIVIHENKILCQCKCKKGFVPVNKARINDPEAKTLYYSYDEDCSSKLEHSSLPI